MLIQTIQFRPGTISKKEQVDLLVSEGKIKDYSVSGAAAMACANNMDTDGQSCSICMDSNEFRALQCGHCFCVYCLQQLYTMHEQRIICPMDRQIDEREPQTLPTPNEFEGQVFMQTIDDERFININELLDAQVKQRWRTVTHLRTVANALDTQELQCAGAKVGGSAFGIIGAAMGIVGLSLSLSGVGAVVGVPLGIAGMGIAAAGGLVAGITMIVEAILKKVCIDKIQEDLRMDYFRAEQIKVLISRAALDARFADRWHFDTFDAVYVAGFLPRIAKLGLASAAGIRVAFGIGRAATTTGLHVAGLVFAAVLIPVDLAQLVISSIRIHKKEPSQIIQDIRANADTLEKELKVFLIDGGYFNLVFTIDGHWAYIAVFAAKLKEFKRRVIDGLTMEQLRALGEIIEEGDRIGLVVPNSSKKKMQEEWYQHYDEYLAKILSESEE